MRHPVSGEVVLGIDPSLRGAALVVMRRGWDPRDPWRRLWWHRFDAEGKLAGQERIVAIAIGIWKTAVREGVEHAFIEQHSFSAALGAYALERAELVGAIRRELWSIDRMEAEPVVASGARRLLFGRQSRMSSKEWKRFIGERFAEMGAPDMTEDERDAMVVANGGRYARRLSFMGVP